MLDSQENSEKEKGVLCVSVKGHRLNDCFF